MNRSLLLVVCDFLLLSLLALAKFEDPQVEDSTPDQTIEEQAEVADEDLIELLKLSLESEKDKRQSLDADLAAQAEALEKRNQTLEEKEAALAQTLQAVDSLEAQREALEKAKAEIAETQALTLAEKEKIAAEKESLSAEKARLSEAFEATRKRLEEATSSQLTLTQDLGQVKEQSAASKARIQFLQEQLETQKQTLADAEKKQAALAAEKAAIAEQKQLLETQLKVAETEVKVVKQTLETAQTEVAIARQEKQTIQQHAERLADGVTVLAGSTEQIRQEVKDLKVVSLNTIFDSYKQNKIALRFTYPSSQLFGESQKQDTLRTVLVTNGSEIHALAHIAQSPFTNQKLTEVRGTLFIGGKAYRIEEVGILASDPRIIAVRIPTNLAQQAQITPFSLAADPLRFAEAVIVDSQDNYYGESEFKLHPERSRYMRMQSTIMSRIFGEFSPARSDLVFAKTGNFLGLMVNKKYAVLIESLQWSNSLQLRTSLKDGRAETIRYQRRNKLERLPREIQ